VRRLGIIFWAMATGCAAMSLYGFVVDDMRYVLSGFTGMGWFTMVACMPREWFLRKVEQDHEDPPRP